MVKSTRLSLRHRPATSWTLLRSLLRTNQGLPTMDNFDMDDLPGSSSGSSSAAAAAAAAAAKRKRQSQSCDACRVRKVKCEPATEADEAPSSSSSAAGGKKPCKHCIVLGLECTYEYKVSPSCCPLLDPSLRYRRYQEKLEYSSGRSGCPVDLALTLHLTAPNLQF